MTGILKFKKQLIWLLIPIFGITVILYYINSYAEFEPIVFKSENDSYETIGVDTTFYKHLEAVLSYYHEPYKVNKSGKILVKQKLKSDKELRFNYTVKALDTFWLNSHKPK